MVTTFSSAVRTAARVALASAAALLLCALPTQAAAQLAGKGEIRGTVTDAQGAAIPGAEIVAVKVDTGVATTVKSTSAGDYAMPTLDPGQYTVTVTANGFQKLTQEHVQVNALETQSLSPKLTIGATTETVTVTAAPPQLETTNATLGATMENEMYSSLPLEMGAYGNADQRRATDFAFLMPGVQGNNTNGNPTTNAGIVNGSGSRGAVSGLYIDGVVFVRAGGNGDPRYIWTAISVDAVDQFQVQTNGYSAIYEGQGIQNYTVKAGGNKYHGAVYEFLRNTALDTWGFFGANNLNPYTKLPSKPVEHSNEYGINLSGPLLPFGTWKDKLFFFGNYNGFRYVATSPTPVSFPTAAEQSGNFAGVSPSGIYDPATQAACTANNGGVPCRYRFGYGPGTAKTYNASNPGNAVQTGSVDVIPASRISPYSQTLQSFLPALSNQLIAQNYISPNRNILNNWSHTERIDYVISPKDTLTLTSAIGRQASGFPQFQNTAGRNVGPIPYNYGQAFAPKTAVGIIEETHTFSPNIVNQIKYGFARYNGPTFNADFNSVYGANTAVGINGIPGGQTGGAFPIVTFSGTNAPTQWAGVTASVTIAQNFTLVDNLQWQFGKHSLTLGGQLAWLQYLNQPATTGSTPLTLGTAQTQTAQFTQTGKVQYATNSATGLAYASFLLGQFNSSSFTQYQTQEFASRFRAISPYIQDNWKVSRRLTLDLGLRWDYWPSVREAHDNLSFFSPTTPNPVTGTNGALLFAGNGANTCNCDTPAQTYWKNFGPRIGFAYQSDEKTVWRGSFGVMFTHGNAVGGGNASSLGGSSVALGFSAAPSTTSTATGGAQLVLDATNGSYPTYTPANGRSSGPAYGTGNTTVAGFTASPSGMGYIDPYLASRAPEYINWSFGFQHQWTNYFTSTISYVGSQGHFLPADGSNARGYWANQLDPQYLSLGTKLTDSGATLQADCSTGVVTCPSNYTLFTPSQNLATLLRPYAFQSVSDFAGNVANSNYHALQTSFNMRPWKGLTFMANYTWSRSIDDGGTFRSGYAIPAAYIQGATHGYAPDRIERTVSTSNQPQHAVITGVWALPFGRDIANAHAWERALLGGFKLSTIFQAYSGSPLAITGASCQTNPAQSTCMPSYNPNFSPNQSAMLDKWGHGVTRANFNTVSFINSSAFQYAPAYTFGNLPRTAAYNLYGPGNYNLDLSLIRDFKLHFWESARLQLRVDYRNVTNHTQFIVASTVYGNASFGQVSGQANDKRAAQLSGRFEW